MTEKTNSTDSTTEAVKHEVIETTFDDFNFEKDETEGGYDELYFVKPKTKDCAYFEFSQKKGDKILRDSRTTIQTIEGKPTKLELSSYTYEKKEIKTFKLSLSKEINGKNVLFIMSSSYTQSGRSILNSLLGCTEPLSKINLTLYQNRAGYTSVKVSINGKKSIWKFSIDEQRNHIETIKNKRGEFISNDYTELDEVFEEKVREHLGVLFPEADHIRFIPEANASDVLDTKEDVESLKKLKDEATFGENDEADFFNIGDED